MQANEPGVIASLDGSPLVPSEDLPNRSLVVALADPADGTLHVYNGGVGPARVTVLAFITTDRALAVTPAAGLVARGAELRFDVGLTRPQPLEHASGYLETPSGDRTPVTLDETASGHWTGSVSPKASGRHLLVVAVDGDSPRVGMAIVSIASGGITIEQSFAERTIDRDNNDLIDMLVVSPTITTDAAGTYRVVASLVDRKGGRVAGASGKYTVRRGSTTIDLEFDGREIYSSGASGPYRVVSLVVMAEPAGTTELVAPDLGGTNPYDYRTFEH